jgi:hypothetical protein
MLGNALKLVHRGLLHFGTALTDNIGGLAASTATIIREE